MPILNPNDQFSTAEIAAAVRHNITQGCLYFGICANLLKIAEVEEIITQTLLPHGIKTSQVILAERVAGESSAEFDVKITDPVNYLAEKKRDESNPTLYLIRGLPELIQGQLKRIESGDNQSQIADACLLLNYHREIFLEKAICAFFWIDRETAAYLANNARDFWSFRTGVSDGVSDFTDELAGNSRHLSDFISQKESPVLVFGDLNEKLERLAAYRGKTPQDENAVGNLLLDIGILYYQKRDLQNAVDYLNQAAAAFKHLEENIPSGFTPEQIEARKRLADSAQSSAYEYLSRTFYILGQLDEAEDWVRRAIEIDERLHNETHLVIDYDNLSNVYLVCGKLDEAEDWVRRAIEIDERLHNETHLAYDYFILSHVYLRRGKLDEAEDLVRKAIEIDERLHNETNLADDYFTLSHVYLMRGKLDESEDWVRRAIEIHERLYNETSLADDYSSLSHVYLWRGKLDESEDWVRRAIEIHERLHNETSLAYDYSILSHVYLRRGKLDEAEDWVRRAIEINERLHNETSLAGDYSILSHVYLKRGKLDEAEDWVRRAIEIHERLHNETHLAIDYDTLKQINKAAKKT
ncbi:MAG: tetratricopeptide repeat protein [Firmicutes bacterium]|nr:tetratricopeptide repeat protein [Bacillota bacterium]